MSGYARASSALTIVRGRAWAFPCAWQDDDGGAIDITGFSVAGELTWPGGGRAVLTEGNGGIVVTSAAGGAFKVVLSAEQTALLPEGRRSELTVTVTDTAGETFDFDLPLSVEIA